MEHIKRSDIFLNYSNQFIQKVKTNTRFIVVVVATLTLLAGGWIGYKSWLAKKTAEGFDKLYAAEKKLSDANQKYPKTDPKWREHIDPIANEISNFLEQYRLTEVSFEGRMLLGDVYFDREAYTEAEGYFKSALPLAQNSTAKAMAMLSLAYVFEARKNFDKAIETLKSVLASGVHQLKNDATLSLARCLKGKGDLNGAKALLEEVKNSSLNTAWYKTAVALEKMWAL